MLPPSTYEVQHARPILQAQAFQQTHNGDLPDTKIWRMFERRFNLNEQRFTHFHPNIAALIRMSHMGGGHQEEVVYISPQFMPPCPIPYLPPGPTDPPDQAIPAVPEPPSSHLLIIPLLLTYLLRRMW